MMGHQYPMLRGSTHGTFCTVSKPQPMYVNQSANKKLSMYSNWRVARFNPNPLGLSSKELMSLHQTFRLVPSKELYQMSRLVHIL